MERKLRIDKSREGTAKPTGKAGPRTWELEQYIYEPRDDQRSSHNDPRLEFALQIHGQHQDSDFIPSDGDPQSLHPACGLGATPDLSASGPSASDQGTLAGRGWVSLRKYKPAQQLYDEAHPKISDEAYKANIKNDVDGLFAAGWEGARRE